MNTRADEPRINQQITAKSIRLIDENGEMIGVVNVAEGMRRADEAGLDLVEISPNAEPPVCKVLDYGKYKYEVQKKAHEAKKKQKVIVLKEITMRPLIDDHDLGIKLKSVHKFISEGDKVKITIRFRGREIAHQDLGVKLMEKIQADLSETVKIEYYPRMEGRQMMMIVAPK